MLQAYYQLRDRTDRFFESVVSRYRDQVHCAPGCTRCCVAGLTVVMVEAVVIGEGLQLSDESVFLQAGQPSLRGSGACPLLDARGYCTVYTHRPLVCRTHGMPLLMENREDIFVCERNFVDMDPHSSIVLNTENLNAALFAVNMVYCRKMEIDPRSRVSLDRLVALAETKKAFVR